MMNLEALTPHDFWDVAVRRKWIIVGSIILALAIAGGLCYVLPKIYRSTTVILVENQKIPESYVSSVVGGTVADRLSSIRQLVLSRTVLTQVLEEFKLQGDDKNVLDKEDAIEALRKAIVLETKASPGSGRIDSFLISFSHRDPKTAMQVTAKLASQFIEENLKVREQLVEGTSDFLEQELQHAKTSLEEQERALADFRRKYLGELPGQIDANLSTLNRLQKDLATVNENLQSRSDRKASIQKMIHVYQTMGTTLSAGGSGEMAAPQGNYSQSEGRQRRDSDSLALRLKELERNLVGLSAEYKETYPDIVLTKQEIAQIKAKLAEKDQLSSETTELKAAGERKTSAISPVDPYLYELKRERDENEVGVAGLLEQQRRLTQQIRDYQLRVERAPEREQELSILERDYENTKKNYQTLLDKRLNAKISQNLEKYQKGEKFRVLDPANLPTKPESPDVVKIMLAGLILGCGLGYGTAFSLEYMRGVIRRPEDAENLLGLPVLATIPHIETAYETGLFANKSENVRTPLRKQVPLLSGHVEPRKERGMWARFSPGSEKPMNGSGPTDFKRELNLVAKWRPYSMVSEQYRVAATRLVLSSAGQKSSVIVVTSALKGEGKSTTASNLAYVLAHDLGKRTLLIDCDFKCPMLHEYMGTPSKPGLAEAIAVDMPLDSCIHRYGESSLWVLPAGGRDGQLVDLTKIPQLSRMLDELRGQYEYIILDAPPILPLADMNLLSSIADMLLMVVRSGITAQDILSKAVKSLKVSSRAGLILNGSDVDTTPKYLREYYTAGIAAYRK